MKFPFFIFKKTVLLTLIICFVSCYNGQNKRTNNLEESDKDKTEKIEELIGLYTDYGGFNGAVLVAHQGEVILKKGFGYASVEWEIPNTPDTKFRIAAITKPFTAILVLQLVAERKLDLHTPISEYLPNYNKKTGAEITIHHLLTHTSGIVRNYKSRDSIPRFPDKLRVNELIKEFENLPLEFTSGEKFSYSNTGYLLLTHIIETVTTKSYETLLKEKILLPLNMNHTGIEKHRPIIKKRAKGYFESFGEIYNANYIDMSGITGVGNMFSTIEDLYLLDQALYNEILLPKEQLDLLFAKHVEDKNYGGYYGYGWELQESQVGNTNETIPTIGHTGVIDGFCARFTRIPSTHSSIIFLNNTRRAFLNAITTAITAILEEKSYDFPLKPLALFMTRTIEKEGIEKGIQFYKEHQEHPEYYKSEEELIVAGYRFLHAGNAVNAAKIFKLSIDVFRDRDNPYDSYAEALMTLGKKEEAILNYKKSLKINPNNYNAQQMIEKIKKD